MDVWWRGNYTISLSPVSRIRCLCEEGWGGGELGGVRPISPSWLTSLIGAHWGLYKF